MNISKIHLHVEQFLLETGRRTLVQRRLYERYMCNQVGSKEKLLVQDLCPWEGTEEEGEYIGGHSSWGVSGESHRLGALVQMGTRVTSPLGWLGDCWD